MAVETIVVAIGSDSEPRTEALAEAVAELAVPTGAAVVLAHVFEDEEFHSLRSRLADSGDDVIESSSERPESGGSGRPEADLTPDQLAGRIVAIRDVRERLEAAGVHPEVRGRVGDDRADAIVDLATDVGADRLVVGGRRRSPAGKAVFGSTAQAVLLNAPCPVEFVRFD